MLAEKGAGKPGYDTLDRTGRLSLRALTAGHQALPIARAMA
jgi:hypothetical protein